MTDDDLAQARLGQTLRGKYTLERVLGVGGMGAVYAATHRNRKQFAVKVLHASLSANPDISQRFLREGRVANTVAHAGAVAVLDDDVAEDGSAFLVMELLEGRSVEALWQQRGLSLAGTLALIEQLLEVLEAAHARGIVHRDLKPANLFITTEGVVKVLDFGIARLREPQLATATQSGAALGTPGFMAPEQARGENDKLDGLADIWAVGATLFQMLSGQLVFDGDNALALLVQAATQPARSLGSVSAQLPAAVVRLVDRALAFDKAQRWPSALAMRVEVRAVRASLGREAVPESAVNVLRQELKGAPATTLVAETSPQTAASPRASGGRGVLLAAGAALTAAVGVWLALRMAPQSERPPEPEPRAVRVQTEESEVVPSNPVAPQPAAVGEKAAAQPAAATVGDAVHPKGTPQAPPRPQPAAAMPVVRPAAPSPAPSAACARLLERQSLGETLSSEELIQLQGCR